MHRDCAGQHGLGARRDSRHRTHRRGRPGTRGGATSAGRRGSAARRTRQVHSRTDAASHLADYLIWWADARTTQEGLTYLSDRLGRKLAGDDITLYSDPQDPRLPACPFNSEGVPRKRVTWVDRGVFKQLWCDRWTAHKAGVEPVPGPSATILAGGEKTASDLIATIERGIIVTHFWYIRSVKADETLVTGMTRDGTFLIEDGKIKHGVKNMRFNESCLGMLQRPAAIGKPGSCVDIELLPGLFPPIVVRDWNFVSSTDF